tara:strand:- start:274 stop:897 length:624 start_codon:yes stop_codon:yes gene_type:complete
MGHIEEIAKIIANDLKRAIKSKGSASLIVCGGNSPKPIFEHLSKMDIGWHKVMVSLVDDRVLPSRHRDSNEKNIKTNLLKNLAFKAEFVSICNESQKLMNLTRPFDVMLLGIGEDGHFASLFPNMITSLEALKENSEPKIIKTPKNGNPFCHRLTMNLAMILQSERCIVMGQNKDKMNIINKANKDMSMPLYYLLNNHKIDITIFKT